MKQHLGLAVNAMILFDRYLGQHASISPGLMVRSRAFSVFARPYDVLRRGVSKPKARLRASSTRYWAAPILRDARAHVPFANVYTIARAPQDEGGAASTPDAPGVVRPLSYMTHLGCAVLLLALAAGGAARAEEPYPTRPLRLVVGFGAGGPTDIPARFVADKLGEALGQRVIVENKPAAAGMIATRDVLSQPRDGYTLLLCTHFDPINTVLYKNAQFKLSDLAPVSLIAKYYYGLALANAVPADDFKAFVQYAKAHPGEVSYATIGAGSAQEMLARRLEKLTGIAMNRIPFRTGPQVVQELVAGRVDFYVSPTLAIVPQYQAKQLKLLAVTAPERLKNLPDIPTLIENGVDFVRFGWLGVCAGAGTPQPILALLQRQIVTIVASPDYREMIEKAGSIAISSTADEFQQVIAQTLDDLASSVREFGLQQEQ
jgi:tripartite-type tricarboxylate transporter receptor subunit TctC